VRFSGTLREVECTVVGLHQSDDGTIIIEEKRKLSQKMELCQLRHALLSFLLERSVKQECVFTERF